MPAPIVMSDLDGVLSGFVEGFTAWVRHNVADVPDVTGIHWDFARDDWGWAPGDFGQHLNAFSDAGGFATLPVLDDGLAGIRTLIDNGICVHFVTSRPASALVDTYRWLCDVIGPEAWRWTATLERTPKVDGHRFVAAIDDNPTNVRSLTETGCPHALIATRPWNTAGLHPRCHPADFGANVIELLTADHLPAAPPRLVA